MASGLIALLDDIAALAKMAAVTLDDAASQTAAAGAKASGIVIDDAAVTPRYVVGIAAEREVPIVRQIAMGSLRNKLLILTPVALLLRYFAPFLITPLLMIGGCFLCLEGFHKVADLFSGNGGDAEADPAEVGLNVTQLEDRRVKSAIRTDFILSAEIMAVTLATIESPSFWMQVFVLIAVAIGITVAVYGAVALIVKADDAGLALAQTSSSALRALGSGIVHGMPHFLKLLTWVGMLAMLWVGGGILVHGLEVLGWPLIAHTFEHWAAPLPGMLAWLAQAGLAGVLGLAMGGVVDLGLKPFVKH
jgi:predicted DNA repair protein MutK